MRNVSLLILSLILFSGCIQQIAVRTMSDIMVFGLDAYYSETDLEFAREGLAGNMKLMEALIQADPNNKQLLLIASQGYSAYALAFAEDDSVERARVFYLRGREYGLRILNQNEAFRRAVTGNLEEFRQALGTFTKEDVPAVFWTAFGWGGFINISRDDINALADLSKATSMMEFVVKTDPGYYYGGAHAFLGAIHGSMPPMLGGKPEVARDHFDKAVRYGDEKFLMTYVYYARTYAVQVQDQQLYDALLTKVEETPLDALPQARLPNAVAKRKAARLKIEGNELF